MATGRIASQPAPLRKTPGEAGGTRTRGFKGRLTSSTASTFSLSFHGLTSTRYRFSPTSELVRLVGGNQDVTQRRLLRLWEPSGFSRMPKVDRLSPT